MSLNAIVPDGHWIFTSAIPASPNKSVHARHMRLTYFRCAYPMTCTASQRYLLRMYVCMNTFSQPQQATSTTTPSSSMAMPTVDLGPPPIHDIISLH